MKSGNDRCRVLDPGRNNPMQQHKLVSDCLRYNSVEKGLIVLVNGMLNMSQYCEIKAISMLGGHSKCSQYSKGSDPSL